MRVNKIVCDRCGAEIIGNPINILLNIADRETGNIMLGAVAPEEWEELLNYDFCEKCTEKIIQFAKAKPENQVLVVKDLTEKEMADIAEAIKKEPVKILPAEQPTVEIVSDSPAPKTPTVQELILQGVDKYEVIAITGCKKSSYDQIKYTLKKKGLLPQQQKQDEPQQQDEPEEVKTYQCSKVGHKCFYKSGNGQNRTCDYIIKTGHRRGCPPEQCDKYKPL